jgi:superkiller protein 3
MTEFKRAIELEPNLAAAYNNLGGVLAAKGSLESSIAHFEEAIKRESNLADSHYNLGLLLLRLGFRDRAMIEFKIAKELAPQLIVPEK